MAVSLARRDCAPTIQDASVPTTWVSARSQIAHASASPLMAVLAPSARIPPPKLQERLTTRRYDLAVERSPADSLREAFKRKAFSSLHSTPSLCALRALCVQSSVFSVQRRHPCRRPPPPF